MMYCAFEIALQSTLGTRGLNNRKHALRAFCFYFVVALVDEVGSIGVVPSAFHYDAAGGICGLGFLLQKCQGIWFVVLIVLLFVKDTL